MQRFLACALALLLAGCSLDKTVPIHTRSDQLVVAVRELPTTYQADGFENGNGFEYDLLSMFAEYLGKELQPVVLPSESDILRHVRAKRVHLAAGWLSHPMSNPDAYWSTSAYFSSQPVVVQHAAAMPLERLEELAGRKVMVRAGSSLANRLYLQRELTHGAIVVERPDPTGTRLIRAVAEQKVELVAVDQPTLDIAQTFLPDAQASLLIGEPREIAWLMPANVDPELLIQANTFLAEIEKDGRLERILDRYFGHVRRLNRYDTLEFISRIRTLLPQYQPLFVEGQVRTGIDWRLLAALSYQESHWNPLAKSRTGVRGMMMLTVDTAERMGVTNRLDAEESVLAGADYLNLLRKSLPTTMPEPDRTWMALASYNLGIGHVRSARVIARRRGVNPDSWYDMRRILPLLSRPEYYSRPGARKARGGEAVILVENIRVFYDILRRHMPPYETFASGGGPAQWGVITSAPPM